MVPMYHWFLSVALFRSFGSRHRCIVSSGLGAGTKDMPTFCGHVPQMLSIAVTACPALPYRPFA